MKKNILALVLILLVCAALPVFAEGREWPADLDLYTTDKGPCETIYKKYDMTFFDEPSEQPGTIVRLDYDTTAYGDTAAHWANVYLPYGYDESGATQYNIIYFLHGTNETQDSFIAEPRAKNAIDNMIEVGVAEPFIMVFPTYYCDYETRAIDMPAFVQEVRNDLMPAVESVYHTYAVMADAEGFIASREHRAFAGYSRGSYATWHMFMNNLDIAKWYMPFSSAISGPAEMTLEMAPADQIAMLKSAIDAQEGYDFYIYAACGGPRDMMYETMNALVSAMLAETDTFSFGTDPAVNNFTYTLSKEVHQTLMARYYLYNAFEVVFH